MAQVKIFPMPSARIFAERASRSHGLELADIKEERFADGEGRLIPQGRVAGESAIVFQSLISTDQRSVNERICELAFFLHSLREQGAREVSLITPYLAYSRSDQRLKPPDPLFLQAMAELLEAMGLKRIASVEVHNPAAYENAFRCSISAHLRMSKIFADALGQLKDATAPIVVLSPDFGGIKRADEFRSVLQEKLARQISLAFLSKHRVAGEIVIGEVPPFLQGAEVIIYDDIISTGGTIRHAIAACEKRSVKAIHVVATHGLFAQNIGDLLENPLIRQLTVSDTNPMLLTPAWTAVAKLRVISCFPLIDTYLSHVLGGAERKSAA